MLHITTQAHEYVVERQTVKGSVCESNDASDYVLSDSCVWMSGQFNENDDEANLVLTQAVIVLSCRS